MSLKQWQIATGAITIKKLNTNGEVTCFEHGEYDDVFCSKNCEVFIFINGVFVYFTPDIIMGGEFVCYSNVHFETAGILMKILTRKNIVPQRAEERISIILSFSDMFKRETL